MLPPRSRPAASGPFQGANSTTETALQTHQIGEVEFGNLGLPRAATALAPTLHHDDLPAVVRFSGVTAQPQAKRSADYRRKPMNCTHLRQAWHGGCAPD